MDGDFYTASRDAVFRAVLAVVGDPVQSAWPDPAAAAQAKGAALGRAGERREFTLRTNYRNSMEIFALAARVLGDLVPAAELPTAVRSGGAPPSVREVTDLPAATAAAALELVGAVDGTVGVIAAMERIDEVRGWLAGLAPQRLRLVGSLEAKGMEYDAVLVVQPTEIVEESSTGRRALYVALTRATQRLIVVGTDRSWLPDPTPPAHPRVLEANTPSLGEDVASSRF